MRIVDVDVVVAGLGSSGAAALARLGHAGANVVGFEARGQVAERANLVLVKPGAHRLLLELERGRSLIDDMFALPTVRSIQSIENPLRRSAAATGVQAHYDAAVTSIRKLEDGRMLVRAEGSNDAYRARYLIDGSGGRAPDLADLAPQLKRGHGRDSYVLSRSAYSFGMPFRTSDHIDPEGISRTVTVARYRPGGEIGTQVLTRMGGRPPSDAVALDDFIRKAVGIRQPRVGAPQVIDIVPQFADDARRGNLLLTGDGISRVHPATARGVNLAVRDGVEAADSVLKALRAPNGTAAERALDAYANRAMERHRAAVAESDLYLY
ncbi:MAG: binding domain [Thermoleophilia bacterium]|nr:binding domain [Thermoleophilia bacterium]